MKKFKNTDNSFGEAGPFEAESKEELAEGMMSIFRTWAMEAVARDETNDVDAAIEETRINFIDALEEVEK